MPTRLLLAACIGLAAAACTRTTALPVPPLRPIDDLPPGQYYDQRLPAPHDVHVRPYTTLIPMPDDAVVGPPPAR